MPRIPTDDDLGLRVPRGGGRTSTAVPNIQLGQQQGLGAAAQALDVEKERLDNQQLAQAEVHYTLASLNENAKYDQDDDLDTIEDRHAAGLNEALGNASAQIMDPNVRQAFVQRGMMANEEAKMRMGAQVFKRKADRERGFMANAFAEIVSNTVNMQEGDQGLTAGGQLKQGITAIQLATDSMVERGIMTNEEAQAAVRAAQDDMALGKLRTMDPEDQLLALNEDWVKQHVDPAVRERLMAEASEKQEEQAAFRQAIEIQDMDELEGTRFLRDKYGDDYELYDRMRVRFLQVKKDDEMGRQAMQENFYEDIFPGVFWGDVKMSEVRREIDEAKLTPAQLDNIRLAEANAIRRAAGESQRQVSDPAVTAELDRYIANATTNADLTKARQYWSENYAKLSTSDFRWYDSRLSPSKSQEPKNRALMTPRQVFNSFKKRPEGSGMTQEQEDMLWDRLQKRSDEYFEANQKAVDNNTVNEWVKAEFADIVLARDEERGLVSWIPFVNDKVEMLATMDEETRADVMPVLDVLEQGVEGGSLPAAIELYNTLTLAEKRRIKQLREFNPARDPGSIIREVLTTGRQ